MMLKVKKLTSTATTPTVVHPHEDLGYDLYADYGCLSNTIDQNSMFVFQGTVIKPQTVEMIPTGIAAEFVPFSGGVIMTRSSMGKKGIIVVGGVVDAGYRGELKVMLANLTDESYTVKHGDKIAQFVRNPNMAGEVEEVDELSVGERGDKGWGSSGK